MPRKDPIAKAEYDKQYMQSNAEKLQRTPKWLTNIDLENIKNKYYLAQMKTQLTGETWHVDHVIPLKGKYVSGLHVPSNLQIIKSMENFKKSNVFKVEYA